jgi:serine/threonine-protein kinase
MRQGRILAGKYRLITKLTEGGMGAVWRAEHLELGSPAAVKLLDPTIADSQEALARFKREAQSAASLRCTNIVQIFDFGVDENLPYIAMELLRGKSLSEKLRAERVLSPEETAAILSQVARATSWAHSCGIVHRVLKPGNIFLSEDADDIVVKLLDFGIAKPLQLELSETPVTLTGAIMGTPQYMSPEQASGKRQLDHRTDIWSFSIIAFECLTGLHAFHADTLGGLVLAICTEPMPKPSDFGKVPSGFDEWFARGAHRSPEKRFGSIAEAADMLRFVCGVETTSSNRAPSFDGTLQAEVRPIATPPRGTATTVVDAHRTTDSPSTTTLRRFLPTRGPRARVVWIAAGLFVAGATLRSVWHIRDNPDISKTPASSSINKTLSGMLPVPLQNEPTRPTAAAPSNSPPLPGASSASSAHVPVGNPMHDGAGGSASAQKTRPKPPKGPAKASERGAPPSSSQVPKPQAAANCDPSVRNRIGICPPTAK